MQTFVPILLLTISIFTRHFSAELVAAQAASFELCRERLTEQQLKMIGPIYFFKSILKGPPMSHLKFYSRLLGFKILAPVCHLATVVREMR